MAAHSVHQIRTSLVGRHREETRQVFTITSPSPDSGKTSLTLALGLSFAASRSRALLIDCDFIGGGLTSKMKMITRRRLGHILRREGVITTPQLVEALKIRARDRSRLGDVLVALGYATQREVDDALELQRQSLVGLREAMLGDPPQECFAETGTPGLYVMPLGSAGPQHVGELSYPVLRGVIEQVRRWFDVIIIDTGPILGSLEASIAALVADEVVLTVARGEERGKVQRSLEQLTQSGVSVAGIVLNRAEVPDIVASGYSSSISRRSSETENLHDQLSLVDHKNLRLGPIGSAVAALATSPSRETLE
jgi:Mrp family chromosome partitioning ATPase